MKLWTKNKKITKRLLGRIPVYSRLDDFDLQIRFEAWVRGFPHIQEIYNDDALTIDFNGKELIIETRMDDRSWTMWCIQYPNTPAGDFFPLQ